MFNPKATAQRPQATGIYLLTKEIFAEGKGLGISWLGDQAAMLISNASSADSSRPKVRTHWVCTRYQVPT